MAPGEPTFEEFKASTLANFPDIDPWEAAYNLQLSLMRRYEEIADYERRLGVVAEPALHQKAVNGVRR